MGDTSDPINAGEIGIFRYMQLFMKIKIEICTRTKASVAKQYTVKVSQLRKEVAVWCVD